jgi:hypothetical protein
MLQLSYQVYEIVETTFNYLLALDDDGWGVTMALEVRTREQAGGASDVQPTLLAHALHVPLPAPESLPGSEIEVDAWPDEDGEPAFLLYVHAHEPVKHVRMKFGDWDGDCIRLVLTGAVDFEDDGEVHRDVPLRLDAPIRFDGVTVDEGWPDKAEARLAQFFDRARFHDPVKREDGAHVFKRRITP